MIKKEVVKALNKQIRHEQTNAHSYRGVALYFESLNLHGLAAWMAKQAEDEREHAEKFIRHLVTRGAPVELGAIEASKTAFKSPLEAVKAVQAMERTTTGLIHKLCGLAEKTEDHALQVALHWFVEEQLEEEQEAQELVSLVEQCQHFGQLFMLDHRWGKKVEKAG